MNLHCIAQLRSRSHGPDNFKTSVALKFIILKNLITTNHTKSV